MRKLIYMMNASLDGYIEDADGRIDWSEPTPEVHSFFNDQQRSFGINLYGRRIYETMAVWETDELFEGAFAEQGAEMHDAAREFADIWRAQDKIVYSRTLNRVTTDRTRLERDFDPEAVRRLKADSATDFAVAGAELAAEALRHGLVDEIRLVLSPMAIGGGKPALPHGQRVNLGLIDHRRFENGSVYLAYRVVT